MESGGWMNDPGGDGPPPNDSGDEDGEASVSGCELRRPVDGFDDPGVFGSSEMPERGWIFGDCLLAEDGSVGDGAQGLGEGSLVGAVCGGTGGSRCPWARPLGAP